MSKSQGPKRRVRSLVTFTIDAGLKHELYARAALEGRPYSRIAEETMRRGLLLMSKPQNTNSRGLYPSAVAVPDEGTTNDSQEAYQSP